MKRLLENDERVFETPTVEFSFALRFDRFRTIYNRNYDFGGILSIEDNSFPGN